MFDVLHIVPSMETEENVPSRCRHCRSTNLTTIVVPVDGSLLSVEYCADCSRPDWQSTKPASIEIIEERARSRD